ncbi:MAG: SGNH/GDSL hydrolase family protein [Pirellulales bacterium]
MAATLPEPTRRIVLLGASNLTRGLHTALTVLRSHGPAPLDVVAALGNGRSYGIYSTILGRGLIGILDCGLWRHLDEAPRLPTAALLTDIGNDVMYGVPVPQILQWVEECLRRLQKFNAEVVITGLPTANLPRLGPRRFTLLRTLLFPRNRDSLDDVTRRSIAVDEGVRELARRYGAEWIETDTTWYGFDPIHFRLQHWPTVWPKFLRGLAPTATDDVSHVATSPQPPRVSLWNSLRTQFLVPESRRLLGMAQRGRQPCLTYADGTRVSLY